MKIILDEKLNTYKGNLHMHTTRSDGGKSLEDAVNVYREKGYDFVAVTDHYKFLEEKDDGILRLSGAEYDSTAEDKLEVFHIVSVGTTKDPCVCRSDNVQQTVDKINGAGGIAILAHPSWSMQTISSILPIGGLSAMEIYNSVSGLPMNCRPNSSYFSDLVSVRGMFLPCLASDDSHPYTFEAGMSSAVVFAESCTRENIISAIKNGNIYATHGPQIYSAAVDNGILTVKCSPVSTVVFYNNLVWTDCRTIIGEEITEFTHKFLPNESFVRVELIDKDGKSAWMSPIKAE